MAVKNYLVEGVSGTGKTSVADELTRRGYKVVHGDRELAYVGDPKTGKPIEKGTHENWLWDLKKVDKLIKDRTKEVFFSVAAHATLSSLFTISMKYLSWASIMTRYAND